MYAVYTQKRDVTARLAQILSREGLRVAVLKAEVKPESREGWYEKKLREGVEVFVAHPRLVALGLDYVEYEGAVIGPFWNKLDPCGLGCERDDWRSGHGTVLSCVQGVHNMETLKIGIREFREKLAGYLESGTPLAITRHGETLGFYIPAQKRSRKAELEAMRAAAKDLDEMIASWGASEDELMEEYKGIRRSAREKRRNAK